MASSTSYGGSESWSVWFGRSSADGTFSMLLRGITSRPARSLMKRDSSHTIVFGTSLMTASPPHMSP
jgi:hypothetical protein